MLLPLFPLRAVLLPHNALPLHIFEERYKLMIGRCIEQRSPFGVVLIRSGNEVGGPAEPFDTGTTARIGQVQRLPDGKMNLIAYGEHRFRVLALDTMEPYLQADVELLTSADVDAPGVRDTAAKIESLFGEHQRLVFAISGQWSRGARLSRDPDVLADVVAGSLDLPPEEKQSFVEMLSLPDRLARLESRLRERIGSLTAMWEARQRDRARQRLN